MGVYVHNTSRHAVNRHEWLEKVMEEGRRIVSELGNLVWSDWKLEHEVNQHLI